jgi:hypothetical protein
VSAVGSLAPMIVELTKELRDPSGVSLYEAWRRPRDPAKGPANGALPDQALVTTKIGSGSDHTVFINHLARPVVEMSFDGPYGVYHSVYDDHFWMSQFGDPGFKYHALMAELWGAMALRLANALVLPFDFDAYGAALRDFIPKLREIPGVADHLDDSHLVSRTRALRAAARRFHQRVEAALASGRLDPDVTTDVNRALLDFEGNWARPEGIPPTLSGTCLCPTLHLRGDDLRDPRPRRREIGAGREGWVAEAIATNTPSQRRHGICPLRSGHDSSRGSCVRSATASMAGWPSKPGTWRPARPPPSMPLPPTRPSA